MESPLTVTNKATCKLHGCDFSLLLPKGTGFCDAPHAAGCPCFKPRVRAEPRGVACPSELLGSQGWQTSLHPGLERGCSYSARTACSSHPPTERKEGSLGLPARWGSKPAQSPGSRTETSPAILRIPFPITTPSHLGEVGTGRRGKETKLQAQIIGVILII